MRAITFVMAMLASLMLGMTIANKNKQQSAPQTTRACEWVKQIPIVAARKPAVAVCNVVQQNWNTIVFWIENIVIPLLWEWAKQTVGWAINAAFSIRVQL
jgi:hypothetical protein